MDMPSLDQWWYPPVCKTGVSGQMGSSILSGGTRMDTDKIDKEISFLLRILRNRRMVEYSLIAERDRLLESIKNIKGVDK